MLNATDFPILIFSVFYLLLHPLWIEQRLVDYKTIVKIALCIGGPYIFTIPLFGQSKGSLPRLNILSDTSQAKLVKSTSNYKQCSSHHFWLRLCWLKCVLIWRPYPESNRDWWITKPPTFWVWTKWDNQTSLLCVKNICFGASNWTWTNDPCVINTVLWPTEL